MVKIFSESGCGYWSQPLVFPPSRRSVAGAERLGSSRRPSRAVSTVRKAVGTAAVDEASAQSPPRRREPGGREPRAVILVAHACEPRLERSAGTGLIGAAASKKDGGKPA